ncbi:MAG: hypothetical protein AAF202_06690, partial [Pseudomonadota bacterium]
MNRESRIRRIVNRVINQYYSRRRMAVIESEIWQATSGGRIESTARQEVTEELRKEMSEMLQEMARYRAEFRRLGQATPGSETDITKQLDEIADLGRQIDAEADKVATLQQHKDYLRQSGKMFERITLGQAMRWLARKGRLNDSFIRKEFDELSDSQQLEIWIAFVTDIVEGNEEFGAAHAALRSLQEASNLRLISATREVLLNRELYKTLGYSQLIKLMSRIGSLIDYRVAGHEAKIAELKEKRDLLNERQQTFAAETAEQAKILPYEEIVARYLETKESYEALVLESVKTSPAVQDAVRARFERLNQNEWSEHYEDYYRDLVDIDQVDPEKFHADMLATEDPLLMFRELLRMDTVEARKLVIDTIEDGNQNASVQYNVSTVLFLLNDLKIEARVRELMAEARSNGEAIDYDKFSSFYGKAIEEEVREGSGQHAWATRFYMEHAKELITKENNVTANMRRLSGQIGPLFIEPPNSMQVANLVAQRIALRLLTWQKQLDERFQNVDIEFFLDRNVALALVPGNIDASVGIGQTLTRVDSVINRLLPQVEEQVLSVSRHAAENGGEEGKDSAKIILTLEELNAELGSSAIRARFVGHETEFRNQVLTQDEIKEAKFPEKSYIGHVAVEINPNLAFFD